jgi:hypothetical protein
MYSVLNLMMTYTKYEVAHYVIIRHLKKGVETAVVGGGGVTQQLFLIVVACCTPITYLS